MQATDPGRDHLSPIALSTGTKRIHPSELWIYNYQNKSVTVHEPSVTHTEIEAATSTSGSRISGNMLVAAEPATTTPHKIPASRNGS